ncbi:MAG TPA: hypothetical protein VFA56_02160 [Gaiellaceae bacterium]|nr:hypothetical protein [Gaiellaceae bacterium]
MRALLVACAAALALVALPSADAKTACPAKWRAGWQTLANRISAPVYCPTWMPNPLDAKIGGEFEDIYSIGKDRSYLVSFLEHGDLGSGDVHVNFRGYPGSTKIPRCPAPVGRGTVACFSEPVGHLTANGIKATVYQVNQGADQWHILLAWHHQRSLYTVSEHVIAPYRFTTQVKRNLSRLLSTLVLVKPDA